MSEPLHLECNIAGNSFDKKFQEIVQIKIDEGMIDIKSEEFPMFGKVTITETAYKAEKNFESNKGVKYFFSIEIDRVSGRFNAYETAAFADRKIFHTTGMGPCTKVTAHRSSLTASNLKTAPRVKAIIRSN